MDFHKFSLKEALNNSKGKTSLGLFMCLIFGLGAALNLALLPFYIYLGMEITSLSTAVLSISTLVFGYLGARRFSNDKELKQENI